MTRKDYESVANRFAAQVDSALPIYSDGSQAREQVGFGDRGAALRIARRMIPADLKRAGFVAGVFESDPEIHGAHYYRIGFSK